MSTATRRARRMGPATGFATLLLAAAAKAETPSVSVVRVPHDGYQPVAAVDARGVVHLVVHVGEAQLGDLLYLRSTDGGQTFGAPLRVTTDSTRACAAGAVRGAQLALGRDGRVHVAWNGPAPAERDARGAPMLYARLDAAGTAFEPPRDVITQHHGLDGGGALVANDAGEVWVAWHAPETPGGGEAARRVYAAHSADDGATFAPETAVSPVGTGVCPCCGIAAFERDGELAVVYRIAYAGEQRDTLLCFARAGTSGYQTLDGWKVPACVMSTYSIARGPRDVLVAFESQGAVRYVRPGDGPPPPSTTAPGGARDKKHPSIACDTEGVVLLAWIADAAGAERRLEWQLFDAADRPLDGSAGMRDGVPAWDRPAAVALAGGGFALFY